LVEATAEKKPGKTFEARFLAELERQSDAEYNPVKNSALREQLGWQDERFDKVRAALIKTGIIRLLQALAERRDSSRLLQRQRPLGN
jgi:hypothetical protein